MPNEGAELNLAIWQYVLNGTWVLMPLVPAILIYLIFPKTQLTMTGPFQGFSVRSTGAFAAYLIVLLATFPLLNRQNENITRMYRPDRPSWMIKGHVVVQDVNGREINYSQHGGARLQVSFEPDIVSLMNQRRFRLIVPEIDRRVPAILLTYPGYGTYSLDPTDPQAGEQVRVDRATKEITITSPIVIRRQPCEGMGCD